jgi:hypothetical protein
LIALAPSSDVLYPVIVWSLAAMAHALDKSSLGGVARTTLGLGEADNFSNAINAVAERLCIFYRLL